VQRPGPKRSHSAASQDEKWRGQARVYSKALVEANEEEMLKAGLTGSSGSGAAIRLAVT